MTHDDLAEIVDDFGRTYDSEFEFDELLDFMRERFGRIEGDEIYDMVASSPFLLESRRDPNRPRFIPRRGFFQGAEFRITPTRAEIEGGFLFPGHRFIPFISRDVFPGDVWLVLPDGSAPRVRKVSIPLRLAMDCLDMFGPLQASEYLETDIPDKESGLDSTEVEATVLDMREYFAECSFKPGDSLMVRVLDWLQGVYAVSCMPGDHAAANVDEVRDWTDSMRVAYENMQSELGSAGDCYEQLAIMMLLGAEDPDAYPLMKAPPLSIPMFFNTQKDVAIQSFGDRVAFCETDADFRKMAALENKTPSKLDKFFRKLGLSIDQGEAEAYMYDALSKGEESSDAVLARIAAGRSLYFHSAEDQENFHAQWRELWERIRSSYNPTNDPFGDERSRLLVLNDKCLEAMRRLDRLATTQTFHDFNMLSIALASMLRLTNASADTVVNPPETFRETVEGLELAVEEAIARLLAE